MFWNKKKNSESDEASYEESDALSEEDKEEAEAESEPKAESEYGEPEENGAEDGFTPEEFLEDDTDETDSENENASVTVKATSLNALAEFISLRHPLNLQFMRRGTNEVFELRESHLRIARVWGSVSMSRECSKTEYAKIMLAVELIESPDEFYVLPALTENDLKKAAVDFCEEKYTEKSKKHTGNLKKFAKIVEANGDIEEWKLFVRELLYKKTEDFCDENGIIFPESGEENTDE